MQFEVIEAILQRHDPTVQKGLRADQLAAEVVNDKTAAQGLHMQGSLVEVRRGVEAEIEHLQRQFAAGDHKGPPARNPARVVFVAPDKGEIVVLDRGVGAQQGVKAGVVDADDLAHDHDRVRHVDYVGEYAGKAERNRSLPIAGGTVEQYGAARVQRWADTFHDAVLEDQVAQGLPQAIEGHALVGNLLQVHLVGKLVEGDRRGPGIAHLFQGIDRPAPPLVGERVFQVQRIAGVTCSQIAQQLAVDGHPHQIEYQVIGQLDGIHELAGRFQVVHVDQLHQQAQELRRVDSGSRYIGRLCRHAIEKGVQRNLSESPDAHQTVSQASAKFSLQRQRLGHILDGDHLGLDQQVSQPHSSLDGVLPRDICWGFTLPASVSRPSNPNREIGSSHQAAPSRRPSAGWPCPWNAYPLTGRVLRIIVFLVAAEALGM